jgi:hypothetical protein
VLIHTEVHIYPVYMYLPVPVPVPDPVPVPPSLPPPYLSRLPKGAATCLSPSRKRRPARDAELWRPYRARGWHNYHAVYHSATHADSRAAKESSSHVRRAHALEGRGNTRGGWGGDLRVWVYLRVSGCACTWVRVYLGAHLGIHLRGLMGGDLLRRDFQAAYDELGDGPGVEHGAAQHRRHPQPCSALFLFLCLPFVLCLSHSFSISVSPPFCLYVSFGPVPPSSTALRGTHGHVRARTNMHAYMPAHTHQHMSPHAKTLRRSQAAPPVPKSNSLPS